MRNEEKEITNHKATLDHVEQKIRSFQKMVDNAAEQNAHPEIKIAGKTAKRYLEIYLSIRAALTNAPEVVTVDQMTKLFIDAYDNQPDDGSCREEWYATSLLKYPNGVKIVEWK